MPTMTTCQRCGYLHEQTTAGCPVPTQNNLTQPFTCPVCSGKGSVLAGFYSSYGYASTLGNTVTTEPCRSCTGTGVVWR